MKSARLTDRISRLMVTTIILFLVTVGGTLVWMTSQLNGRATGDSVKMMAGAISDMLEKTTVVALDYSIWNEAYDRILAQDDAWIEDNFASGAVLGDAFQILALTDAPFDGVQSWADGGSYEPQPDLVPQRIIEPMRKGAAEIPIGEFSAEEFFARIDGEIYALSGTRVSPHDPTRLETVDPETFPLAIFGSLIDEDILSMLAERYLLDDVRLSTEPVPDAPSLPLAGPSGEPVAYITWAPSTPGGELLQQILLPLVLVFGLFTLIAGVVTFEARQNARHLIDEKKRASKAARTDSLTGLPNRTALNEALQSADGSPSGCLAIVFMDLNAFKTVNDTVGHDGGDDLVRRVAERLRGINPAPDLLARAGGDEFVLVAHGQAAFERGRYLAQAIRSALLDDFHVGDRKFHVTAAVGLAVQTEENIPPAELLRRADLAMYHAKRMGTTEPTLYDTAIESDAAQRKIIEEALREALERPDEFAVHYQPIVDAKTGRMVRAECLARWTSRRLGRVGPDTFISVAEETGLIVPLGQLLFVKICRDLERWSELSVSINISPAQLNDGEFVKDIVRKLNAVDIPPSRIEIELTESVVVTNTEMAAFKLDQLSEAGFATALDDFGTGFSSLGYLKRLPFDTLKIDKSFVAALPDDRNALKMVEGIVMVGKSLGQTIVCEGVETEEQAAALRKMGCDQLQGYHFARPMPFDELIRHSLAPKDRETSARSAG